MTSTISSLDQLQSVREYLARIGAEPRSLRTAVVKENVGRYWRDLVVINFDSTGIVRTTGNCDPTPLEQAAIAQEWATVAWPTIRPIANLINTPRQILEADPKDVFEFRDASGNIVMMQVRMDMVRGENMDKRYVPWTYWSDDVWRQCEPDGFLPLYNAHRLGGSMTVFIHEGAKAARHVQWMVDGETAEAREALERHPWGREFQAAVHVGWIGGALSPYRTDWSVIRKAGIQRAYIVSDNDDPGREAVPKISQQLNLPAFQVQFTEEFPASFDLADPFPEKMFGRQDDIEFYIGRGFREYLHPATWATDLIPNPAGKGKPIAVLRDCFRGMWAYVEEADMFICKEMPDIIRTEAILNKMLAPFSHTSDTCKLILKAYQGRSTRICYRPDQDGLLVTFRGSSAINLHVKPSIAAQGGDVTPFLEFVNYMFPNERERHEVLRWCATLIARPGIRMGYGLLLISEAQGVGKTTLGALVLSPLVGETNVGYPSEKDIGSDFNDWVANKRLVIVNEIYSGASWKAYHSLKSTITDRDVTVNQKYMRPYVIENWVHIIACSNSMRALKMENDDRRWFYPEVTERAWSLAKFTAFRRWLDNGGLSIIRTWAENFGDYVGPAERAPMTGRKREMIEGSRSEAQAEAVAVAESVIESGEPVAIMIKDLVEWCRSQSQGRVFDTDYELRRAMAEVGMIVYDRRIKIANRPQYVMLSPQLSEKIAEIGDQSEQTAAIRAHVRRCNEIMQDGERM